MKSKAFFENPPFISTQNYFATTPIQLGQLSQQAKFYILNYAITIKLIVKQSFKIKY